MYLVEFNTIDSKGTPDSIMNFDTLEELNIYIEEVGGTILLNKIKEI